MLVSRPDISFPHLAVILLALLIIGAFVLPEHAPEVQAQDRASALGKASRVASPRGAGAPLRPSPTPIAEPSSEPIGAGAPRFSSLARADAGWPEDGLETRFTFVQISDTHVGRDNDAHAFQAAVAHINALEPRPAFAIITGDLTDGFMVNEVAEFKRIVSTLEIPVRVVPGNHDEGFDPNSRAIRFYNAHFPKDETPYRFDHGEVAFIGLDSQLFNARSASPEAASFARTQWEELVALLDGAYADHKRIVLFHHIPFYPSWQPHRPIKAMWKARHRDAYRELLARYEVEAELTGHFHRDELYVERDTLLLNAPPISQKFGRRSSYRVFRVTDKGLSFRQIYFLDEAPADLSYQVDLHSIDVAAHRNWLSAMPERDMHQMWRRRQAFDDNAEAWWAVMDREQWRTFLSAPLDFEPPKERLFANAHVAKRKMRESKKDLAERQSP